jgi:8-oxo-dGTP pyrophosphatase MutT (NUDIX family)
MAEPTFIPKPGQVDYTNIRYAPTVNIVVTHNGKILCVQRSADLRHYPGKWDWICGFLDDSQSIEDKTREELREELGLDAADIESLVRGQAIVDEAPEYHKTWFIVPVLAKVKTDRFTLDWEASRGQWFEPSELKTLDMVPDSLPVASQFFPELV